MHGPVTLAIDAALSRLETLHAALGTVGARCDEARKRELVELRRQLSVEIAAVAALIDRLGHDLPDELRRACREHLSRMRSRTALHQAQWPAVRLGEADDEYRASAAQVRAASVEFFTFMRATLEPIGRSAPSEEK